MTSEIEVRPGGMSSDAVAAMPGSVDLRFEVEPHHCFACGSLRSLVNAVT